MKILSMPKGGPSYTQAGLTVYSSRCTIDDGGYYIEDGRCYVDITITLTQARGNDEIIIKGFPRMASAGSSITVDGIKIHQNNVAEPAEIWSGASLASGTTHHFVGSYLVY